jgi:type IV pilus assembly protein PilB
VNDSIGDVLFEAGVITDVQLREALAQKRNRGMSLGEALLELGHVDEVTLYRALAKLEGLPFVDLAKAKGRIPEEILERVPQEYALEQGLVPVLEKGGRLIVAIDDPLKRMVADQLAFLIGTEVACAMCTPSALAAALRTHYGAEDEAGIAESMGADLDGDTDAPIVRLVTRTLKDALEMRASDIHFEPMTTSMRVRFRIDGVLRKMADHPLHLAAPLVSRLKIMGSLDIAEKRKPQDGRIGLKIDGRDVDVRASILPTNHGESIVLRLLDRSANLIGLRELGFDDDDKRWFEKVIRRPHGIVLVTGPTGSGKTTTLYAALSELNRPDVKIITAEDPVEYHIAGINQVQANPRIGLDFARILKAMLRAAPNVILVGEIRDVETAEVAIQAALTGHLVFSTIHTNDAPSAITRLVDMGVQPFLVASAVQAVLAQRLVRRLCDGCAEVYQPTEEEIRLLDLDPTDLVGATFRRPRGCRACEGSGYLGRVALYERFELDSDLRDLVFRGASLDEIRRQGIASDKLHPLSIAGARKVMAGLTSVLEILRVTRASGE